MTGFSRCTEVQRKMVHTGKNHTYISLAEGSKESFSAINKYINESSIKIMGIEYTLEFFL